VHQGREEQQQHHCSRHQSCRPWFYLCVVVVGGSWKKREKRNDKADWGKSCRRQATSKKITRLCGDHFVSSADYFRKWADKKSKFVRRSNRLCSLENLKKFKFALLASCLRVTCVDLVFQDRYRCSRDPDVTPPRSKSLCMSSVCALHKLTATSYSKGFIGLRALLLQFLHLSLFFKSGYTFLLGVPID
jgi:hypothetical protein